MHPGVQRTVEILARPRGPMAEPFRMNSGIDSSVIDAISS
jgi:hypothetical protein